MVRQSGGMRVRRCFFFNDTATTEIYTLSLHDALPISWIIETNADTWERSGFGGMDEVQMLRALEVLFAEERSEEHTSELQSQSNLVCRLLLAKKKTQLRPTPATTPMTFPRILSPKTSA